MLEYVGHKGLTVEGMGTHIWRKHGDGQDWTGNNDGYKNGSRTIWNKGLTKETDERMSKMADTVLESYKCGDRKSITTFKGRTHTQETKDKISKSRIKYLAENPDKVPYLLNHKSKGESYPEKYFREILEKEKVNFIQEKQESVYSLDFVIGTIDLEIDGEQHYVDSRIVESDKRRTIYLENMGYTTIRVRWAEYQKLNRMEREQFIKNLLGRLN